MIQVACVIPNLTDTTSFYRGAGVFNELRRIDPDIHCVLQNEFNWAHMKGFDIVFMQRPASNEHLIAAELILKNGKPFFIDFDDDLLSVPEENPHYLEYRDPGRRNIIETILQRARLVTCTTKHLQMRLSRRSNNVKVIPNALDDYVVGAPTMPKEKNKIVLWRGSESHRKDILEVKDDLQSVMTDSKYKEWRFVFWGAIPWFLDDKILSELKFWPEGRYSFVTAIDVIDYFIKLLREINPAIVVVPLKRNHFNLCKSNNAAIEAAWCGAVTIAPRFPEWMKPGIINYDKLEPTMRETMDILNSNPDVIGEKVAKLQNYICQNLLLSQINKERAHIIRELTGNLKTIDERELCLKASSN